MNGFAQMEKRKKMRLIEQPEPKPNLFAKWICLGHKSGFLKHPESIDWKCSNCSYESYWFAPPVCPNCRAKMNEVEDVRESD